MLKTLFANFRISVQIIFAILTGYLLYQEIILFVSVPVHTSKFKKTFSSEQFPDFVVCHTPGYKLNKLLKYGYTGSATFQMGVIQGIDKVGWIGKNSSYSVGEVVSDISTISAVDLCPPVKIQSGKAT